MAHPPITGNSPAPSPIYDVTVDQITTTADAITRIRPAYAGPAAFYGKLFSAQAHARDWVTPEPVIIDEHTLGLKQENQMPLITPSQFTVDVSGAARLMHQIACLAKDHAPKLARAGKILADVLDKGKLKRNGVETGELEKGELGKGELDLAGLFSDLLAGRDIRPWAENLDITAQELAFFGFSAMAPSIQVGAARLAAYIKDESQAGTHWCPLCGSEPDLLFLDESGKRRACCSLCSHVWQVPRMGCLFCKAPSETPHYFFSKEEPEFRVYCCDACEHYIKAVDTRELNRRFIPRLEQVTTLHLDLKAREKGYRSAGEALA